VVLESDPTAARATARGYTEGYLGLPNYADNLRRLGYSDHDLLGSGSDRLVDSVIAWGDAAAIADRVREFHQAGADHVCLQVVEDRGGDFPFEAYRALAEVLTSG
jgi:probable F420-dependent oxidoreductase